jgi:hypothetical protein
MQPPFVALQEDLRPITQPKHEAVSFRHFACPLLATIQLDIHRPPELARGRFRLVRGCGEVRIADQQHIDIAIAARLAAGMGAEDERDIDPRDWFQRLLQPPAHAPCLGCDGPQLGIQQVPRVGRIHDQPADARRGDRTLFAERPEFGLHGLRGQAGAPRDLAAMHGGSLLREEQAEHGLARPAEEAAGSGWCRRHRHIVSQQLTYVNQNLTRS